MSLEEALKSENLDRIQIQLLAEIAPKAKSKGEPFCWTDNYARRKIGDHFNSAVLEMSGNWDDISKDQIIQDGINFIVHGNPNTRLGGYFRAYAQNVNTYVREIQTSAIEGMTISVQDLLIDPAHLHYSYKRAEFATLKLAKIEAIKWLAGLIAESNLENKEQLNQCLEVVLQTCSRLSFEEKVKAFFAKMWLLSTDLTLFYRRSSHNGASEIFDNAWTQLQLIAHAGNQYDFSVKRALKVWGIAIATGLKFTASAPLRTAMLVHKMFDTWTGMPLNSVYSAMNAYPSASSLKPAVDVADLIRKAILPFAETALLLFLVPLSLIPCMLVPVAAAGAASVCMVGYSIHTGVKSMVRALTGGRIFPEVQAKGAISALLANPSITRPAQVIAMLKYQHPELMAILPVSEVNDLIAREFAEQEEGLDEQADQAINDANELGDVIGQQAQNFLMAQPLHVHVPVPVQHVQDLSGQPQLNVGYQSDAYKRR